MSMPLRLFAVVLLLLSGRAWCAEVDAARLSAPQPGEWPGVGRNYAEDRFSPLDKINASNVHQLGLAWAFDTGQERGMEATPVVVDGVMYTSGNWGRVFAIDARTGQKRWEFDPQVPGEVGRKACCDVVNRGVAVWGGKVFVGAMDGRLIALDAATGEKRWETMTVDPGREYTITGAPRVVKGLVVIGNGGGEFGVRGYFSAYDANTGELRWRFHTVPDGRNAEQETPELARALETWSKTADWTTGGGGTVWDSMAYDPVLNLLYVGVGNGSPWNKAIRSPGGGDNLYLSSILALNPDTGRLAWHYQTTPGESWDFTATQHMILADMDIEGVQRKVLMQAPKNGFFYVLDRETGKLLSANNYVKVTWASHVDLQTGRPVLTGHGDWDTPGKMIFQAPGALGGHSWMPMAWHPGTGLVYIPAIESTWVYMRSEQYKYLKGDVNTGMDTEKMSAMGRNSKAPPICANGRLIAWDPRQQKARWSVEHAGFWNGGVLATAGNLVFQGTEDGRLVAYAADTGDTLWQQKTTIGIIAAPMSYELDGEQYIAVMVGFGGIVPLMGSNLPVTYKNRGYVMAFKLDGRQPMPAVASKQLPDKPDLTSLDLARATPEKVERGYQLYSQHCLRCHGMDAEGNGLLPALQYMSAETHRDFDGIVLGGLRQHKGMASFYDMLKLEDVHDIHAYLISEALKTPGAMDKAVDWVRQNSCIPQWMVLP